MGSRRTDARICRNGAAIVCNKRALAPMVNAQQQHGKGGCAHPGVAIVTADVLKAFISDTGGLHGVVGISAEKPEQSTGLIAFQAGSVQDVISKTSPLPLDGVPFSVLDARQHYTPPPPDSTPGTASIVVAPPSSRSNSKMGHAARRFSEQTIPTLNDIFSGGSRIDEEKRARDRRQHQAMMLAEQIVDQRRRKAEDMQRLAEQERREEMKWEREQHEIMQKERLLSEAPEYSRVAPGSPAAVVAALSAAVASSTRSEMEGAGTSPPRRRRSSKVSLDDRSHGSGREDGTAARWTSSSQLPSSCDLDTCSPSGGRRRRRRRKVESSAGATWRTDRTWGEGSSVPDPDTRCFPTPWVASVETDFNALNPSEEGSIGVTVHRTRKPRSWKSPRDRDRDRHERQEDRDTEREPRHIVSLDSKDPYRDIDRTSEWEHNREYTRHTEHERERDLGEHRDHRHPTRQESIEWVSLTPSSIAGRSNPRDGGGVWVSGAEDSAGARVVKSHGQGRRTGRSSDGAQESSDLRDQLGSLLRVCEQLLREKSAREEELVCALARGGRHRSKADSASAPRSGGRGLTTIVSPTCQICAVPPEVRSPLLGGGKESRHASPRSGRSLPPAESHYNAYSCSCHGESPSQAAPQFIPRHNIQPPSVHSSLAAGCLRVGIPSPTSAQSLGLGPQGAGHMDGADMLVHNIGDDRGFLSPSAVIGDFAGSSCPGSQVTANEPPPNIFNANARGMALRRSPPTGRFNLATPQYQQQLHHTPVCRGSGLNVQCLWPAGVGRGSLLSQFPIDLRGGIGLVGSRAAGPTIERGGVGAGAVVNIDDALGHLGPGHIPIGIRPSIQAQSAMLRELYRNSRGAASPTTSL